MKLAKTKEGGMTKSLYRLPETGAWIETAASAACGARQDSFRLGHAANC